MVILMFFIRLLSALACAHTILTPEKVIVGRNGRVIEAALKERRPVYIWYTFRLC